MRRLLILVLLAVTAASCGGSGTTLFRASPTRTCLAERGVRIGGKLDFVASTATGGAFKARLGRNGVTVVFGKTEDDARQIELVYREAAAANIDVRDVLGRKLNAVLLWREHPSDDDLRTVADCLKR